MKKHPECPRSFESLEYIPKSFFSRVDSFDVFNKSKIEVDLGCAEGQFIFPLASKNSDTFYLGIERLLTRVRKACRRGKNKNISNVRFLRMEILYALEYLLPIGQIDTFYLFFPDPWPKKKHTKYRLFSSNFRDAIFNNLKKGGKFYMKTDFLDYFQDCFEQINKDSRFQVNKMDNSWNFPQTRFEKLFNKKGKCFYGFCAEKIL